MFFKTCVLAAVLACAYGGAIGIGGYYDGHAYATPVLATKYIAAPIVKAAPVFVKAAPVVDYYVNIK